VFPAAARYPSRNTGTDSRHLLHGTSRRRIRSEIEATVNQFGWSPSPTGAGCR